MKNLIFIVLTSFTMLFLSCENRSNQIDSDLSLLKHENDSLKSELNKLKHLPEECQLIPMTHFLNYNIKKGDTAKLYVSMAKCFNDEFPKVIIWNEKQKEYTDTFLFKSEFGTSDYIKYPAMSKGKNWIKGKVEFQCGGRNRHEYFETMYIVD